MAGALVALLLALLAASQPAAASPAGGRRAAPAAGLAAPADETLSILKSAATGSGEAGVVFNGEIVTYTLVLTNNSASLAATDVNVIDILPIDTLDNLVCTGCEAIYEEQTIPEPLGGTLTITVTRQLSWTLPSLAPGASTQIVFTGRVTGQSDGTVFKNRAFATYLFSGSFGSAASNETETTVRVRVDQSGQPSLADAPTWFSADIGGTLSQDWGDFNNDGYLDLVLASSVGTSVYRNEQGRLVPYWTNSRRAYGVRWADFNGDGRLDLVTVGDSLDGSPVVPGTNYLYTQGTGEFVDLSSFVSPYQYVRVAVGDFDRDGDIDLIASTNTLNAACPVQLMRNNGAGVFPGPAACVSTFATAALGPGDVDNDGDLDLAIGLFPDTIQVLRNDGAGNFGFPLIVDSGLPFLAYDFAWGDYDSNGFLDLAAAFPLQKEARVYRNLGSGFFNQDLEPFRTSKFLSPLALDWGDFTGDGLLDLAVADEVPRIYVNRQLTFDPNNVIEADVLEGQVWSLRAAQIQFAGDLDLSLTNRDDSSLLLEGFAPHLATDLLPVDYSAAGSLAWGDADGDGDLDMLLGAGPTPALGSKLYLNEQGQFPGPPTNLSSGLGPQSVAFGDVNGDGRLDMAVGTAVENQLYLAGRTLPSWTASAPNFPAHRLAFGDANGDGRLDLLVGANGGGLALYLNTGTTLADAPAFVTSETGDVRALAWADFDRDFHMDFVAAFYNQPARLYRNNQNNTFTPVWNSGTNLPTTSLAVADFNADGYPDLALGHYQAGTQIYENLGAAGAGLLAPQPAWTSPTQNRTVALAWGDWDSDGYPDLAVGNQNQPSQVFGNLGSSPGAPRLFWLWTAAQGFDLTGLAWGDFDGDGDLDLGVSQRSGAANGYYPNGTITPSHLTTDFVRTLALPNNPSYLAIKRPGGTSDAYLYSSSEIIGELSQTVTISYTVYDPDGSRRGTDLNAAGNPLARTYFEYSLDGGSTWRTASPAAGSPPPANTPTRLGQSGSFVWDAMRDQAISDDARFRVRIVPQMAAGPVQHAASLAVSPPFRIRAVTCLWPENPYILTMPAVISPSVPATFIGGVAAGSGVLTYTWDFGGGTLINGQITQHSFPLNGTYPVTLTVSGRPCPKNRPVAVTQWITVGSGQSPELIHLPFVANSLVVTSSVSAEGSGPLASPSPEPTIGSLPPQATDLPRPSATAGPSASPPASPTLPPADTPTTAPSETSPPTAAPTSTATETGEPSPTGAPSETPAASPSPTVTPGEAATSAPAEPPTETPAATPLDEPSPEPTQPPGGAGSPGRPPGLSAPTIINLSASRPGPLLTSQHRPLYDTVITATQITTLTPGINNEPVLNANGTRVAFWSTANLTGQNPDGNIEVFLLVRTAGGQTITQISHSTGSILGGFNLSPSIDAAGTRVAFFSDRDLIGLNPDNNFEIFLYDAAAQVLYQVTNTTKGFNILPSLSGSGQYLAFASDRDLTGGNADGNTEIFRAQILPGGGFSFLQVTSSLGGINDQPRLNHAGTRLAFVSNQNYPVDNAAPINNADNNREVFLAEIGAPMRLVQVTSTDGSATGEPAIDASGARVAFVSDRDPTGGGGNPNNRREIFYADISPGYSVAITQVTTSVQEVGNAQPSISADGTRIGFVSPVLDQVRMFDSLLDEEFVSTIGASLNPSVSADGTALVFAHNRQLYLSSNPMAELWVTKTAAPLPVFENQPLRFTIVVSNAGPSLAEGIRITETLPSSGYNRSTLVTAITQGSCNTGIPVRICTVPALDAQTAVTLTVDLTPTRFGNLSNTVDASMLTFERLTDNEQTVSTAVQPVALDSVTLTGPTSGVAHELYAFTAVVSPIAPSLDLTYTWQASGQPTLVYTATAITRTESFAWNPGGVQVVTVTVANPAVPVRTDSHVITINNPAPTLASLAPTTATINSPSLNLTLTGTGFVANSQVRWDGSPIGTTYVSSTTLQANVPVANLAVIGSHLLTVFNPAPGGGTSNSQTFTVNYPQPHITSTAPSQAIAGGPAFTLVITGSNFVSGAQLHWSGRPSLPTFGSGTTLTATIPASYLQVTGTVSLSVTNPLPNNGPSNVVAFQVNYPQPTLTQISPLTRTAGGLTFTLTLTGSDFIGGATLQWGSQPALPTFGSGTTLTATIPANYINTTGSVAISVNNPLPNAGASGTQTLVVQSLQIDVTPENTTIGVQQAATLTVTVNAAQAAPRTLALTQSPANALTLPPAVVLPAGSLSTTFVVTGATGSNAVLTTTLPAAQGGLADAVNVTVQNPQPIITALTPLTTTVRNPSLTLTITGTNFMPGADVVWNGTTLTLTGGTGTTLLTAVLPPALVPVTGTYTVVVENPPPGPILTSNPVTVTAIHPVPALTAISPNSRSLGSPGFTLVVTGTGFIDGASVVHWNGSPRATTFVNDTRLTASILAGDLLTLGPVPVTVVTGPPGGGTSAPQTFTVTPVTINLTPSTVGPLTLPAAPTLQVAIGVAQPTSTVVTLSGAPGGIALVPASVTIPAGSLNRTFVITGQISGTVSVTAALPPALGGASDSSSVTFHDAVITGLNAVNNGPVALTGTARMTATVTGGTNISYTWSFGDGSPATAYSPNNWATHIYANPGIYTATVTARNTADTDTDTTVITVNHPQPTLSAMSPLTLTQDLSATVLLTGTQFYPGVIVQMLRDQGGATTRTYTPTYISSTQLSVVINGLHINAPDGYSLWVVNPAPPAAAAPRTSNELDFVVQ